MGGWRVHTDALNGVSATPHTPSSSHTLLILATSLPQRAARPVDLCFPAAATQRADKLPSQGFKCPTNAVLSSRNVSAPSGTGVAALINRNS